MNELFSKIKQEHKKKYILFKILLELSIFIYILSLCLKILPINVDSINNLTLTVLQQSMWNRINSHLHGRLEEVNVDQTFYFKAITRAVKPELEKIKSENVSEIVRVVKFLQIYNKLSLEINHSEYSKDWTYQDMGWDIGHPYQMLLPHSWLMEKFALSEIYLALLILINSWFGLYCLFLITKRLTGSYFFSLLSVLILNFFTIRSFPLIYGHLAYTLNLLPLIWIGQLLAQQGTVINTSHRFYSYLFVSIILVYFGFLSNVYLFFWPVSNQFNSLALILTLFFLAFVRFDKNILIRASAAFIVYIAFLFPFQHYKSSLLKPLGKGDMGLSAFSWMLYERPNPYGFPHGDYCLAFVTRMDPFVYKNYPFLKVFHSGRIWGKIYFKEIITHRPWVYLDAWWKRLYTQIFFHRIIAAEYCETSVMYLPVYYIGVISFFITMFIPKLFNKAWPIGAIIFNQLFAANTFLTVVHNHPGYIEMGLVLLLIFVPVFISALCIHFTRYSLSRVRTGDNN